jgi:glycosyltransferase involved in cell wall biosynthesis
MHQSTNSELPLVAVDGRKAFDSGIGVVIRGVLGEFGKNGFSVAVICKSNEQKEKLQGLIPELNYSVARAPNYSIKEQFAIPLAAEGDVLWSPHYNVPVGVGIPVVSTVHDLLPLAYPQLFPGLRKQVYARLMFRLCAFKSSRVVCVSEFTAQELSRFTGCPKRKIRVVPNGVASRWFGLKRVPDPADPFFLFVGNLKPHKNLNVLLAAFESVSSRIPHRLVVVGQSDGFITSDKDSVTRLKNTPCVTFSGAISDEQLEDLMSKASALVVPSVYEGFGLPALEALAAGVPVVASNIPPLTEICGDEAIYFDPMNPQELAAALFAVSTLPAVRRDELSRRGKARAQEFSWERAASAYLRIFSEMSYANK